ncbi:unnamed protein product, partial [Mesorhabditis belari]|uniref:Uncharacterized protein n=1 Tax=Mesorhabditis belari TaxID=2138241 RepID=A0AAF3F1Y8_9BILA
MSADTSAHPQGASLYEETNVMTDAASAPPALPPVAAQPTVGTPNKAAQAYSDHAESVVSLAHKYRAEFEETFDGLRQRAIKLQEQAPQLISQMQANIEPYKQDFLNTVQAFGDVATPALTVLETLSWSAVLVLASNVTSYVSAYLYAPILSLALGECGALGLALTAVPVYAYWTIQKYLAASAKDVTIRFHLLAVALLEGLLVGFIQQNSYLSGAPLGDLLLAITAFVYAFAAEKFGNKRQMLLSQALGASIGVTLLLGFLTAQFTLPYLLLTLLYGAITARYPPTTTNWPFSPLSPPPTLPPIWSLEWPETNTPDTRRADENKLVPAKSLLAQLILFSANRPKTSNT